MSLKDEKGVGGLTPEKIVGHQSFIMNGQMTLFGVVAPPAKPRYEIRLSRRGDPITSALAARKVCRSGKLGKQKRDVLKALQANNGSTSGEVSAKIGNDRYVASRRLPDLERDGLVARGPARKCTVVGSMCLTWWVTEKGKKWKLLDAEPASIESD